VLNEVDIVRLWHTKPAEIFNIRLNTFAVGDAADFFLFDPSLVWRPDRDSLHSKSLNTPFLGRAVQGKVTAHWLGARRIV
jgi:dihydroorotase